MTIAYPRGASLRASSRPTPRDPPVTSATGYVDTGSVPSAVMHLTLAPAVARRTGVSPGGWPGRTRQRLDRARLLLRARQSILQPSARPDPQLREHLVEVPFDGPRAQVELRGDLCVRAAG